MATLGIDFGGSGIKGAPVDLKTGELLADRYRLDTPDPSKPKAVAEMIKQISDHFEWKGKIGVGFPAVIRHGVAFTAANIHKSWIGTDVAQLLTDRTGCPTTVINDADAAGLAEMTFGAGKDRQKGVILLITLGTGIGTAIFVDGRLLPNTELGHIQVRGKDGETRASDAARQRKEWSWSAWGKQLNEYLQTLERLISPDLIIVGGGVSKQFDKFSPYLKLNAEMIPAQMLNLAGIVGAALAAGE